MSEKEHPVSYVSVVSQFFKPPSRRNSLTAISPFVYHAVSTPLTTLRINLDLLSKSLPSPLQPYLSSALASTQRLEQLMSATTDQTNLTFQVQTALQEILSYFRLIAPAVTLSHHFSLPYHLRLRGHPFYFQEALLCLLTNAQQAYQPTQSPLIVLTTHYTTTQFRLSITDGGKGILWWQRPLVLAEGVSLRPGGTGLGLAWVRRVVKEHLGGALKLTSQAGKGTTVMMELPLA